jgi:hypothetical protein
VIGVRTWLHEQEKEWYQQDNTCITTCVPDGTMDFIIIHALVYHWHKAVEVDRDLVDFGDKPSHMNVIFMIF